MAQIGAIFYILWGILHIFAAYQVYKLGARQSAGMVQGRVYQSAWNLAFAALFIMGIAIFLNWPNTALGYWLNLAVSTVTDVGFILFVLRPGYLPLKAALPGPVLWVLALAFSTLAQGWVHL